MSKKTSKVLVFAVITVLVVSMLAMVACGPKDDGGKKPADNGAKPLDGATAMETLSTSFADAATKSVTEKITVGGLNIALSTLLEIKIDNVDITLVRSYDENNVLTLDATIENLKASVDGDILSMLPSVLNGVLGAKNDDGTPKVDMNKDKVSDKFNINIPAFAAALDQCVVKASVKVDPRDADSENYLVCDKFEIAGLSKVATANGEYPFFLYDGDGAKLTDPYEVIKASDPKSTNPRHVADKETNPKDADGIFYALDTYSTNNAGTLLETFIADNYQMASLYDFGALTVNGNAISFNGAAALDRVYALGQSIVDGYGNDNEYAAFKDKDGNPIKFKNAKGKKYNGEDATIHKLIERLAGSTKVETLVGKFVTMGNVNMTGNVKADGKTWKLADMTSTQVVTVDIPTSLLKDVVGDVLPMFGVDISDFKKIIDSVLDAMGAGVKTSINVKTVSTFNY